MAKAESNTISREATSLENCDKEPVHIPGHIQDFAVIIAVDKTLSRVIYCSANIDTIFDRSAKDVVGAQIGEILDRRVIHDLNNTLSLSSARLQRERVSEAIIDDKRYEIWAHLSHGIPVIEFETVQSETITQNASIMNVRSLLARLGGDKTIQKSLEEAVINLRHLSGYDRVLAYQFDSNGDGEIKAEARSTKLSSFLGLRFPRWDIPNQARDILKKVPLRLISDVNGRPVPLVSDTSNKSPLDLTLAASRGVSPIHMEYLRNMGVQGTMTLSIVVRGELWGLFAFHHTSPRNIGPGLRSAAELFAQFFSLQLEQRIETELNDARSKALEYQSVLLKASEVVPDLSGLVREISPALCQLVGCDGMALISAKSIFSSGTTPSDAVIRTIGAALIEPDGKDVVVTDRLANYGIEAAPTAGAIALSLDKDTQNIVIFFRNEAVLSVRWAGAPKKHIVDDNNGVRLKPRGSFEVYEEAVKNKSKPWSHKSIVSAKQIGQALTKADSALFRRMTHKAERQRSIYIAELNHRVRNILSLIRSLSRRTQETSYSLESYAKALERRINALGTAHDLAASHITNGIVINELFKLEVKPFENNASPQLFIQGETFVLRADIAPVFALIVHELITNCVKYGALSTKDGRIDVHIKSADSGVLITWTETGGPQTVKPTRRGFGLELIENAVPYELGGRSKVEFRPEGLRAEFWLPLKLMKPLPEALDVAAKPSTRNTPKYDNIPETFLIVEDSLILAIDMENMLKSIGAKTVEKAASVHQAKARLESFTPDFVILDINLKEEQSFEVAEVLVQKNVLFCFATGYGSEYPVPEQYKEHLVLTKPVDINILRTAIKDLYICRPS
jgi:light-regulated signal transduction histidine kinase (bacteriophytochrome)